MKRNCCGACGCPVAPPKKTITVKAKIKLGGKISPILDTIKRAEDAKVEWANSMAEAEFQRAQRANRTGRKY